MIDSQPQLRVPYLDLRAQYDSIRDELLPEVAAVFEKSAYILGPAVERFEADFARFCDAKCAIAVNNGTAALHLALLAHGIGPGDEVITQANTFIATVAAIMHTGATPVLVDVAPPHYTIDVEAVRRAITPRTRAIIPVHLYGHPCDIGSLEALAGLHGIHLIEDASQAHGATYSESVVGSRNTSCFSFYPGKNLGAAGEGGGITTNDSSIAARVRRLRNHGSDVKYVHEELGYNYRLEGLQGAVLGVKLRHLAAWTEARRSIATQYDELLSERCERPALLPQTNSAYHIYPIFVDRRTEIANDLKQRGVETNIHYPIPCHLQPGYVHLGYSRGSFPNSELIAERELSLPIYPEMTTQQVEYVSRCLIDALTDRA